MIQRDIITGQKSKRNPLNKAKLSDNELFDIMMDDEVEWKKL